MNTDYSTYPATNDAQGVAGYAPVATPHVNANVPAYANHTAESWGQNPDATARWPPPYGQRPIALPAPSARSPRDSVDPWLATGAVGSPWEPLSAVARPPGLVAWVQRKRRPMWAWTPRHWLAAGGAGLLVVLIGVVAVSAA